MNKAEKLREERIELEKQVKELRDKERLARRADVKATRRQRKIRLKTLVIRDATANKIKGAIYNYNKLKVADKQSEDLLSNIMQIANAGSLDIGLLKKSNDEPDTEKVVFDTQHDPDTVTAVVSEGTTKKEEVKEGKDDIENEVDLEKIEEMTPEQENMIKNMG